MSGSGGAWGRLPRTLSVPIFRPLHLAPEWERELFSITALAINYHTSSMEENKAPRLHQRAKSDRAHARSQRTILNDTYWTRPEHFAPQYFPQINKGNEKQALPIWTKQTSQTSNTCTVRTPGLLSLADTPSLAMARSQDTNSVDEVNSLFFGRCLNSLCLGRVSRTECLICERGDACTK